MCTLLPGDIVPISWKKTYMTNQVIYQEPTNMTLKDAWEMRRSCHTRALHLTSSEGVQVITDENGTAWIMNFSDGGGGDWLDWRTNDPETKEKFELIADLINLAREYL